MRTLDFGDGLVSSRFSAGNDFLYEDRQPLGMRYDGSAEKPYILRAPAYSLSANGRLRSAGMMNPHPNDEVHFSAYNRQLRGRTLNAEKIRDLLNLPRMPLIVSVRGIRYLMGKGFLAHYSLEEGIYVLFLATTNKSDIKSLSEVRFCLDRAIQDSAFRTVWTALKPVIDRHPGEVLWTSCMSNYTGKKLELPSFKSLKDRREYTDAMMDRFIRAERAKYDQITPPSSDPRLPMEAEVSKVVVPAEDL